MASGSPGLDTLPAGREPTGIAEHLNGAAKPVWSGSVRPTSQRRLSLVAVHEFEAWLFSDSAILAAELGIPEPQVVH